MTYQEALEATVSRVEARREIAAHEASFGEFEAEYGEHDEYEGADVLCFLGY